MKPTKRERIESYVRMFWTDLPDTEKLIYSTNPCATAILGAAGFRAFDRHIADTGSYYVWARDGQGRSIELRDSDHFNWNSFPDGSRYYTLNVWGKGALRFLLMFLGWKGKGKGTFANVLEVIEWNMNAAIDRNTKEAKQ